MGIFVFLNVKPKAVGTTLDVSWKWSVWFGLGSSLILFWFNFMAPIVRAR